MTRTKASLLHDESSGTRMLPLILKFAVPSVVSTAVIALYSLADAYFVSSLGKEAGAAVGVSFAIVALLQAVGYTLGMGGGEKWHISIDASPRLFSICAAARALQISLYVIGTSDKSTTHIL